jgi:hypothetical protein
MLLVLIIFCSIAETEEKVNTYSAVRAIKKPPETTPGGLISN